MREKIVKEIRRIANKNGGQPPGARLFEQETAIRQSEWRGVYWARWGDALTEAGFAPNTPPEKLEADSVLKQIADTCRKFGKLPSAMDFRVLRRNDPTSVSYDTIGRVFQTNENMVRELAKWTAANSDYADVATMLNGRIVDAKPDGKSTADGYVYLIQWGANYKIGRGEQLEKRVKQVRTGLPDSGELIHAIKTDDPAGIEAYWHRRFAEKRAPNGEWFKLSKVDVAAFKRRKFQ